MRRILEVPACVAVMGSRRVGTSGAVAGDGAVTGTAAGFLNVEGFGVVRSFSRTRSRSINNRTKLHEMYGIQTLDLRRLT